MGAKSSCWACSRSACWLIGIWPKPLTDLMEPSIAQLAMQLANSKL